MKKFLLTAIIAFALSSYSKSYAQCTLSNVQVDLVSATLNGAGNCQVTLNMAFDIAQNNGNKFIYINLWNASTTPTDYSFNTFNYGAGGAKGPKLNELDGATHTHAPVAIIGLNNNGSVPAYLNTYSSDPLVTPVVGTSIQNTGNATTNHFILSGLTFVVPGACSGLVLEGDVWSTQSNSANPAIACFTQGISFFGDPTISGQITCSGLPKQFQVVLHTVSISPIGVNYKVYIDNGPVGKDASDVLVYTSSTPINISAATPYTQTLTTWSGDQSRNLLVELNVLSPFTKTIYDFLTNSCATLPVNFQSFTATRTRNTVALAWTTASEQNNSGFEVERQIGTAGWQSVYFVPSQALSGNSSSALNYTYNDANATKGISNYRIRQIDLDGKMKYSPIRSVRGEGQLFKTIIYPNPSSEGKVNVVFENTSGTRDLSLMDISGRTVKQWSGITNNNLVIDNLNPGFYQLRIVLRETGEQSVEKIVVNKR